MGFERLCGEAVKLVHQLLLLLKHTRHRPAAAAAGHRQLQLQQQQQRTVHCACHLLLGLLLPVLQQPLPLHLQVLLLAVLGRRDTSKQCLLAGLALLQGVFPAL
jgi:hypothetical protein